MKKGSDILVEKPRTSLAQGNKISKTGLSYQETKYT